MALSNDEYQSFEDIVGADNISNDPVILKAYTYPLRAPASLPPYYGKSRPAPVAVVMPSSTDEVQAIVRMCNRYKLKCKAFGTGWSSNARPLTDNCIQLDLRRMNRILEIDENNMFAVVEPYVIGSQLQAEAMKVGLNCHMIGAGGSASVLASATSYKGEGPDSISLGYSSENLLAAEWVMPNGDIMRTGSLGSGCGWFCGEGPGPSTRGVFRGLLGAFGSLGVFTKAAIKLSPWPGPAVMPIDGEIPAYTSPLPDNFRAYTLAFPSWEAFNNALYMLYDSEIVYIGHKQFTMLGEELSPAVISILKDPSLTLDDLPELLERPDIKELSKKMRRSFQIVLAGRSRGDTEYQDKILDHILAETGGTNLPEMAETSVQKYVLLYLIKLCFKNVNYMLAGGYQGTFAQYGPPDFATRTIDVSTEVKKKHIAKGGIVNDGGDASMGPLSAYGGGGVCGWEQFMYYDAADADSTSAAREYFLEAEQVGLRSGFGPGRGTELDIYTAKEKRQAAFRSASQPDIFHWPRKIKKVFDPGDIGDWGYLHLEEP